MSFLIVSSFFLLLIFIFWQISSLISLISGTPSLVRTKEEDIKKALSLADLKKDEIVYDLGCGDGRVLIRAAKDFKALAFGFEISPWSFFLSKWNLSWAKINPQAKVYFKNLYKVNLEKADLVFFYLMPKMIEKLKPKLENELNKKARVISYDFPIKGWEPIKKEGRIYVYKI